MSGTIAVTGATGFIGRYLVRALMGPRQAGGGGGCATPSKLQVDGVEGAVRPISPTSTALARAFTGCDAVISNAGVVSIGGKSREALRHDQRRGHPQTCSTPCIGRGCGAPS